MQAIKLRYHSGLMVIPLISGCMRKCLQPRPFKGFFSHKGFIHKRGLYVESSLIVSFFDKFRRVDPDTFLLHVRQGLSYDWTGTLC